MNISQSSNSGKLAIAVYKQDVLQLSHQKVPSSRPETRSVFLRSQVQEKQTSPGDVINSHVCDLHKEGNNKGAL